MIPQKHRGLSGNDIAILFRSGRRSKLSGGMLRWRERPKGDFPRLAVIISSKSIKRATERARIRRKIQAAFLPILKDLNTPADISVAWFNNNQTLKVKDLIEEIKEIFLENKIGSKKR